MKIVELQNADLPLLDRIKIVSYMNLVIESNIQFNERAVHETSMYYDHNTL